MGRKIAAVVVGLLVGVAVVGAMEAVGHAIHPPPPGLKAEDVEVLKAYIAGLPLSALLLVLLAHALGGLAGGGVATLVAGRSSLWPALLIGALLLLGGILNVVSIPHPLWFAVIDLALYLPAAALGGRLALKRPAPSSPAG